MLVDMRHPTARSFNHVLVRLNYATFGFTASGHPRTMVSARNLDLPTAGPALRVQSVSISLPKIAVPPTARTLIAVDSAAKHNLARERVRADGESLPILSTRPHPIVETDLMRYEGSGRPQQEVTTLVLAP